MFRLKVGSRSTTTTADSASASATAALRSLARLSARTARRNPVSALLVALFVVYLLSARAGFPDPDPDRDEDGDVDHDDYELGRHPNPHPHPHPNLDRVQRREDPAALHAEKLYGRRGRDEAPPVVEDGRVAGATPQPVPVPVPAPPAKDAVRVVDEGWLAGMLVRVGLGPPADEVPPELKEVVADMLDLYSPRRYEKYAWDL